MKVSLTIELKIDLAKCIAAVTSLCFVLSQFG